MLGCSFFSPHFRCSSIAPASTVLIIRKCEYQSNQGPIWLRDLQLYYFVTTNIFCLFWKQYGFSGAGQGGRNGKFVGIQSELSSGIMTAIILMALKSQ